MSFVTEINKSICNVFRRAYIKRRNISDGTYEISWYEITSYIKKWGNIQSSIDEIRLNNFKHSGITLSCKNDNGAFNPETYTYSLWKGYMTRFRTLLKIEAGYLTNSDIELPTTSTQGIFILANDPIIVAHKNEAILNFKSLVSLFTEELVTNVAGLGGTATASDIITKIRDHTDGSGNVIFRQVISLTSWIIQTTTSYYNLATTTSLDGLSCWELMNKLAEAEGYILLINRTGGIEFRDRNERTTTSQFDLFGQGYKQQNIIRIDEYKEPINKYFNYFRLKFLEADTSTSYVSAGTMTTLDPSASSWKYGVRKYEFENTFINDTTTAQNIVNSLLSQFDVMKEELKLTCKFLPQLEISDKVTLSYRSYDIIGKALHGIAIHGVDKHADESQNMLTWENIEFKILARQTNLDNFTTNLVLRRI